MPPLSGSRLKLLQRCSGELFDRLEILSISDSSTAVMSRGVLFLMAFWSGPAVLGLANLCDVLKETGLPHDFTLRILDIDGASNVLLDHLSGQGPVIGGNAEAYWFREGDIFAATHLPTATSKLIRELLSASGPV